MILADVDPVVPSKKCERSFAQTIRLKSGDRLIGQAMWTATAPSQGVVQILEMWIDPAHRRTGQGRHLLSELLRQAVAFHKLHGIPFRRIWIGVGHKTQVVGRSFLSGQGFHHVGTTCGLLEDEDLLIYVKSLD